MGYAPDIPKRYNDLVYTEVANGVFGGKQRFSATKKTLCEVEVTFVTLVDLRGFVPFPSQISDFFTLLSPNATVLHHHLDKMRMRETVFALRNEELSYRDIAEIVWLHWTRIGLLLRSASKSQI